MSPNLVDPYLKRVRQDPLVPISNYVIAKSKDLGLIEKIADFFNGLLNTIVYIFSKAYEKTLSVINSKYFINILIFILIVIFTMFFYKVSSVLHQEDLQVLNQMKDLQDLQMMNQYNNII
jgi:hypothetical protein